MAEERPGVSVVVPAVSGSAAVLECLFALAPAGESAVEVLVVGRGEGPLRDEIEHRFPSVRWIGVPPATSLAAMRREGLLAARGETIAVLGEHLRPGPGWLPALTSARPGFVVGGPIEAGRLSRAAEWAFFLLEYARFLPPLMEGPAAALPGTNCVYDRRSLERLRLCDGPGDLLDHDLHEGLRGGGVAFEPEPRLLARCEKRLEAGDLLSQRYHGARSFAAHRARGWAASQRLAFVVLTPLLPVVLLNRLVFTLIRKRRYGRAFLRSLPLIMIALSGGALGEALGVLQGPGRSGELAL